ncbi:MAG TPA: hypothetical protein VFZ83_00030 [Acidimicrobiia bacterium]|nr:hypothetical protein [Acidimicrobiia bacterium]
MDPSRDLATVSSLSAQIVELTERVTDLADGYRDTPDSAIASELYSAERALLAVRRSFERVARLLDAAPD